VIFNDYLRSNHLMHPLKSNNFCMKYCSVKCFISEIYICHVLTDSPICVCVYIISFYEFIIFYNNNNVCTTVLNLINKFIYFFLFILFLFKKKV